MTQHRIISRVDFRADDFATDLDRATAIGWQPLYETYRCAPGFDGSYTHVIICTKREETP